MQNENEARPAFTFADALTILRREVRAEQRKAASRLARNGIEARADLPECIRFDARLEADIRPAVQFEA